MDPIIEDEEGAHPENLIDGQSKNDDTIKEDRKHYVGNLA
jgi:hypothetical protein